jgi:hypothetical protein
MSSRPGIVPVIELTSDAVDLLVRKTVAYAQSRNISLVPAPHVCYSHAENISPEQSRCYELGVREFEVFFDNNCFITGERRDRLAVSIILPAYISSMRISNYFILATLSSEVSELRKENLCHFVVNFIESRPREIARVNKTVYFECCE